MPQTPHVEKHFTQSDTVRDIVIGMSDGLTVPFALAAGLSGAAAGATVIVTAGLAEIAAGSISMGLGGYLAARSDAEHYYAEQKREEEEVEQVPDAERQEVADILNSFGVSEEQTAPIVDAIAHQHDRWIDFMMRFELGLDKPDPKRALTSALTIAGSYVVAGFIPLSPYIVLPNPKTGLFVSVAVTGLALAVFGYIKGRFTGVPAVRSALQTLVIGGLAAGAAFLIAQAI